MVGAACDLPEATEDGAHGIAEGGAGTVVGRREPLLELGCGRDALGGGDPRAAVDELRDVLERTAARVVERDRVDEPAVDRHVCLLEVRDVVRPGRRDRL